MNKPSLILKLGFVQCEQRLNTPRLYAKYADKRQFYSCNQDFNYVAYVNQGSKEKIDYIAYSGNKEKSMGVFGKNGLLNPKEQAELKKRLRETKSVIWHGVIAFEQDFGKKYMGGTDDAIRLMNTEFPRLFRNAGLNPDNITWYAGLHENTQKRHIHFSFFENEPARYTKRGGMVKHFSEGHIPQQIIDRFKLSVQRRLTDVTSELKLARKNLTDIAKDILFSVQNGQRNLTELQEHITGLIPLLPTTGRLAYDSENMEHLKPQIKRVVDLLIKSNPKIYAAFLDVCDAAVRKDMQTKEMLISQKIPEKDWGASLITDKVLEDIYRRLGNFIINTARVLKSKEKPAPSRSAAKRIRKQTAAAALKYCLNLGAAIEQEALDAFRDYMKKLKEAQWENETEEMEKEENEMD